MTYLGVVLVGRTQEQQLDQFVGKCLSVNCAGLLRKARTTLRRIEKSIWLTEGVEVAGGVILGELCFLGNLGHEACCVEGSYLCTSGS